eukprot:GFYU01001026.1.p1 GENE.GFYU01001026.1~~GFYU01001026.1.p1  ORF type:complete len:224 (-),score=45.08 GFYU01001026.1:185-811(-)
MSIMEYNGGAVIAMVGKNCVGMASDLRFGVQAQTLGTNYTKIWKIHDKCMVGMAGLATDQQTLAQKFKTRTTLYKLKEEREIKPSTFSNLVTSMLYEKRFGPYFVEPAICGLEDTETEKNVPFICTTDLIGAQCRAKDFVVVGTASEALYGTCETMYAPDLEPDDLFEVMAQCLLASVDRDCVSGWGGEVVIMTPDSITTRQLKGRMD